MSTKLTIINIIIIENDRQKKIKEKLLHFSRNVNKVVQWMALSHSVVFSLKILQIRHFDGTFINIS